MTETKIEYHADGKTIKSIYTIDEHGVRQGDFKSYHENGQLEEKCTYKDGKLDGLEEWYYPNGQLMTKCTYKDGKLDGQYETYYPDGQLEEKCTYENGELSYDSKARRERKLLNIRLTRQDERMKPTAVRQLSKRVKVAKFRAKFREKSAGK